MLELNKIYNMDCIEGMKEIPDNYVDLVLTDPPYGITKEKWDVLPNWDIVGNEFKRISKPLTQFFIFGMQPTFSTMIVALQKYLYFKDEVIWLYRDGGAGNTKGTGLKNIHQNIAWFSYKKDEYHINQMKEINILLKEEKGFGIQTQMVHILQMFLSALNIKN